MCRRSLHKFIKCTDGFSWTRNLFSKSFTSHLAFSYVDYYNAFYMGLPLEATAGPLINVIWWDVETMSFLSGHLPFKIPSLGGLDLSSLGSFLTFPRLCQPCAHLMCFVSLNYNMGFPPIYMRFLFFWVFFLYCTGFSCMLHSVALDFGTLKNWNKTNIAKTSCKIIPVSAISKNHSKNKAHKTEWGKENVSHPLNYY